MLHKIAGQILILVLIACTAIAAPEQDNTLRGWQNNTIQPSGTYSRNLNNPLPGSDDELLMKMQDEAQQKLLQEGDTAVGVDGLPTQADQKGLDLLKKSDRKKPFILLSTEPGDGLVKISWKVLNLPPRNEEQPLRFVIRYGIESEKLVKSLQVGKVQEYVLRELKNNQPYYVQVVAMDREQQALYKSEEIRITPLPTDALGSRIEKSYSRKPQMLLDKTEPVLFQRELKQYGYDFFRNSAQLSQSVDNLPSSDDYLMGPGDSVKLTIVGGAVNSQQELTVDRNGELLIPKVGSVKVWGLSFIKAKESINKAISRFYRNISSGCAHRDAYVCKCECRRIVNSITNHSYDMTFGLHFSYKILLLFG